MELYQYLQTNSNYFYANKLNLSKFDNYTKTKIKIKKYTQEKFDSLIENLIFGEQELYVFIKTKDKGEFLLSNINIHLSKNEAIEYLKLNSIEQAVYLFDNVDYFSYGRFGIAKNGKIERYLSYNSEPIDDENMVEWIGKPHKWEYETHTFFTKKKLEDCEMFFDSDIVCEMSEYYLPFITESLDFNEIIVISKEKLNYNNSKKTQKLSLNRKNLSKINDVFKKYNVSFLSLTINSNDKGIILSNYLLRLLSESNPININDKILSSNTIKILWTNTDNLKKSLLNDLTQVIIDFANAKEDYLINIRNKLIDIDNKLGASNLFYIHFFIKKKNKYNLILTSKKENHDIEHNLGNKLNLKTIDKILKLIGQNVKD